jgi:hypothetical protein
VPSGHAPWLAPALIGSWRLLDADADLAEQAEKDLLKKKIIKQAVMGSSARSVLPRDAAYYPAAVSLRSKKFPFGRTK